MVKQYHSRNVTQSQTIRGVKMDPSQTIFNYPGGSAVACRGVQLPNPPTNTALVGGDASHARVHKVIARVVVVMTNSHRPTRLDATAYSSSVGRCELLVRGETRGFIVSELWGGVWK